MRLEQPCLHDVAGDYEEQRQGLVHVVQRSRGREHQEREEQRSREPNANLH